MTDPHAWPPHPHIAYALDQLGRAREEVRAQFTATNRDEHPDTWDALRRVVFRLGELEDEARAHCRTVAVAQVRPSPRPRAAEPHTPLDPDWEWQTHEAQQ